ncbi:FAD-dependent oxidoreductase [Stieleria varia]|nr:FAD-dependent oxidoreductase [Stieleria varia]
MPQTSENAEMLRGGWLPEDPHQIDYDKLPLVPSQHIVISDVRANKGVNQHNYLAFHRDRYFAMWSDGPGIEDRVGQRVKYSTSVDSVTWSEPRYLTPVPPNSDPDSVHYGTRTDKGMRWISRGFWQRDGELLALCSLDEAAGFFGPGLRLHAFRWTGSGWDDAGIVADNAINNFPPKKIDSGDWMMSRRKYDYKKSGVEFLVGGVKSIDDWESFPVLGTSDALSAEEPLWWSLPDDRLVALFRDNQGSKFLYRSISEDQGRTWTRPIRTNFPDATSKLFGLRLSDGRYVLISNSNPRARNPLTIAISDDGLVFKQLAWLVGGRHVDYPHAIEHDGHLLVAFAGGKQSVEILRIKLSQLDAITMPSSVKSEMALPPIGASRSKTTDWIDLGEEGKTLYVAADLIVPEHGKRATLSLATTNGEKRVVLSIDEQGQLAASLFRESVTGPKLIPGTRHSLLIRVHSHRKTPDELNVQIGSPGELPAEPKSWTLSNVNGSSNANLARVVLHCDTGKTAGFENVRIAPTCDALVNANVIAGATSDADVVVYGGTPGGLASAIAAARLGRQVIVVEPNLHIGGMTTSGLGKSDVENRAMIGGIFREFVQAQLRHYLDTYGPQHENITQCRDGYYAEPSVSEAVFESMLAAEGNRITVLKGWRLGEAHTSDETLRSITAVQKDDGSALKIRGKVFIDATYEGDLYAAAGAEYRLGREAMDEFNEAHAGVVYFDYQEKKFLPGTTGEASEDLPAFTYRLCLTKDPQNSHKLSAPPIDYDRSNYLGYFDDLKAGRLSGPKIIKPGRGYNPKHFDTLVRVLSVTDIPNNKTDVNMNPRPLGFPFTEENRGYIEGDEVTRQRIRDRIRNLTLGLIWFLQTDPEVPEEHRKLANELHFPKDEFTDDKEHFPFQLYVREGRRLVGEFTLTEHHITGKGEAITHHQDTIAIGEFPIDSFPCRKRQPGDTIVLEGYLGMLDHITRPYEIPYRVMIPQKINGIIVPVAASTTHVAFSSIRMEPTWMALGQAAGTAAHLAIEEDVPPRDVPIEPLQAILTKNGQVLSHSAAHDLKN